MKGLLWSIPTAIVLLLAACKKDNDQPDRQQSHYTLDGTDYTTDIIAISGDKSIQAVGEETTFGVTFYDSLPSVSGNYKIVRYPSEENEIQVIGFLPGSYDAYYSTGIEEQTAIVTIEGIKLDITVPEIWAKDEDSLKVKGRIVHYFD